MSGWGKDEEEAVEGFAWLATEFCNWAESDSVEPGSDMLTAAWLIARLYAAVMALPDSEPIVEFDDRFEEMMEPEWKKAYQRFATLPVTSYREFRNPAAASEDESVVGDLAVDLADIFKDLKDGLFHFDSQRTREAAFHWRFSFGVHWGRHAVSALHAIHGWLVKVEEAPG